MSKQAYWLLGVSLTVVLVISLLINFVFGFTLLLRPSKKVHTAETFQETLIQGEEKSDQKIAVIDLSGVISYSVPGSAQATYIDDIKAQLEQARKDEDVAAIILSIDSPGGEVAASDTLYQAVKKLDTHKPVLAYINSVGASGAYYTAVGARHIMAHELALTASIGVILQTINYEKLTDFVGVQTLTFKSGKMKDLLNPSRPMTEEERSYVQAMIDETYGKFVGIVAERRKLDETSLRSTVADGRVMSGKSALGSGLIDSVGMFEDAIRKTCELAKLPQNTAVVRYVAPFTLSSLTRIFGKASDEKQVKLEIVPQNIKLEAGKFYYLSPHLFWKP